jgi:CHAD domain-containing protein
MDLTEHRSSATLKSPNSAKGSLAVQYRLSMAQPLQKAIPAIAAAELDAAIARLDKANAGPEAVHAARKHFKRTRALLSLVEPAASGTAARTGRKRLARTARKLAASRDAQVAVDTAKDLEKDYGTGAAAQAFSDWIAFLKARRDRVEEKLDAGNRKVVTGELKKIKASLLKLGLNGAAMTDLLASASKTYRAGRRAMKAALKAGGGEALHEWRKLAQRHWRHTLLLKEVWPQEAKSRVALARRLCDLLGQYNDLTVMHETVHGNKVVFRSPSDAKMLCHCIGAKQKRLLKKAASRGSRLYAEKPKAFARRFRAHWQKARRKHDGAKLNGQG